MANKVKADLKNFQKYAARQLTLVDELNFVQENLARLGSKLLVADIARKNDTPRKYTVTSAKIADYKDTPKRSIIVLVAAIASFFVALFAFIIVENIKRLK